MMHCCEKSCAHGQWSLDVMQKSWKICRRNVWEPCYYACINRPNDCCLFAGKRLQRYTHGVEYDAHEFLLYLLSNIAEESRSVFMPAELQIYTVWYQFLFSCRGCWVWECCNCYSLSVCVVNVSLCEHNEVACCSIHHELQEVEQSLMLETSCTGSQKCTVVMLLVVPQISWELSRTLISILVSVKFYVITLLLCWVFM